MNPVRITMDALIFEDGLFKTTVYGLPVGHDQAIWTCPYLTRAHWRMAAGTIYTRDMNIWIAVATREEALRVMHWIFEDFVYPTMKLPASRWEIDALTSPRNDQRKEA